jgi:hypothetical protein
MSKKGKGPKAGPPFKEILKQSKETRPHERLISLSLKYLSTNNKKFCYQHQSNRYFSVLLDRLKSLSCWTGLEFHQNTSKALRAHQIDWQDSRVTENGFGIPNGAEYDEAAYQFQLSTNEHGRVHGFLIDTVFYVV